MDFEKRISDYGMTPEQYEASFAEITAKVQGNSDKDWTEIIDQYSIPLSRNTLRNAWHVVMTLWAYFHEDPNVLVDVDMHPRKYREWGNSLIMYAHGDKEGKRVDKVMQVEAREAFGRTKYHEAHLAHLHSEQAIKELGGLIIRNLPSVTGEDNWSHESGFIGAVRKCICFIWDKEKGLKGTTNIVID